MLAKTKEEIYTQEDKKEELEMSPIKEQLMKAKDRKSLVIG
jgi:hypothetical protein